MEDLITSQLDKVEQALNTLSDSIATYNPSVSAAQALLQADNELQTHGVPKLRQHQRQHARIQQLKSVIARQDRQITAALELLSSTRTALHDIPACTSESEPSQRQVTYPELLDYARRISRTTPRQKHQNPPLAAPAANPPLRKEEQDPTTAVNSPTSLLPSPSNPSNSSNISDGIGVEQLLNEEKNWLLPTNGGGLAWPSEETIKQHGALSRIQAGRDSENEDLSLDELGRIAFPRTTDTQNNNNNNNIIIINADDDDVGMGMGMDIKPDSTAQGGAQAAAAVVAKTDGGGDDTTTTRERPREREQGGRKVFGGTLDLYDPDAD